ncbi:methylmalonyl-CoA mutase [Neobacillus mesonae]|uniref:acyl-CoA mutase large subunit family protein n=1 Tax=Neobacillus mesonae TaxID=1193713 RepID=UPI00203F92A9|nr:methylmalonyl-CoA mutase family protein [Neobacillus mesonae]MCM3566946.1 methylmalonyl-CoA mutase family protein [Neobacillus mesonae]
MNEIKKGFMEWEQHTLEPFMEKKPERKEEFYSLSGIPIKRLYTPLDVKDFDYNQDLGFPGEFPYTRGVYPTMYRGRVWTHRQIAGFGTAKDTNERFRFLSEQGQTGLSVDFDHPTLIGLASDDALSIGEVGMVGVAIDSLEDMEELFEGIDIGQVSTSMTINFPAPILFAMYLAMAKKRGVDWRKLAGTLQFDLLKEFIAQKTYVFPPEAALQLSQDVIQFASENVPRWNPINVCGYHIRDAGGNAIQEIAFALSAATTYVETALEAGLKVDDFAPRLSFFFISQIDFFEELAKFRAARRIWAKLMREKYSAKKPESLRLRFHCQTAGSSLTAKQPMNNIIRTTLEALAAVLGGAQSLHTNGMDEALAVPSEEAMQLALRTQQIIAEESGVVNTIDPLGGSYFIETLTNQIEEKVWGYLEEINRRGGYVQCVQQGYFEQEIAKSAYTLEREKTSGERTVVGVNKYKIENEILTINLMKVDPEVEKRQIERLNRLKEKRDNKKVELLLARIRQAAESKAPLMPHLIEAVEAYTTEGEIIGVLKEVFGEYQDPGVF